ncbi:MAG: hypothetical protein RQ731_02805 [Anaerosomatales bacterium]|nr:hypothetical protein [Anaerosomatales bacterium]
MTRTCNFERMNVERLFARAFVVIGGLLWTVMLFASETAAKYTNFTYTFDEVVTAMGSALLPLAASVLVFVVGLFYEKLTALILVLGAAGVVVWGVIAGWAAPLWVVMGIALIGPMLLAALLFLLASRMQMICMLESHPGS